MKTIPDRSATQPLVSTIIPTFNRRTLVCRAIDSALAQTYPAQEIIVVDDGSTDGTKELLLGRYGERIRYVARANGGVSRARNQGLSLARGEFLALLDSDDEWHTEKLALQVDYLLERPDFGMVMNDVQRVDPQGRSIDVFHRRDVIAVDGDVLAQILMNPALVPASILMRRAVYESLGGFDETLRTAEDIDFHLRVAAQFKIGVIPRPLTTARRGGQGLSEESESDRDYVGVMARFIRTMRARIPRELQRRALFCTYERNARSALLSRRTLQATDYLGRAFVHARSGADLRSLFQLILLGAYVSAASVARAVGIRRTAPLD